MKKISIIMGSCLTFMIVGILLLSSKRVTTAIGNWVWSDAGEVTYTPLQTDLFIKFMLVLFLGTPFLALTFAAVRRIIRKRELKRLEREGKFEEYREKAQEYNI